jgi:hypothetical protein
MKIFRKGSSTIPASPVRQLYGKKTMNGQIFLIAPLDIILWQVNNGGPPVPNPHNISNQFNSSIVRTPSGQILGDIKDYDFPPALPSLNIKPIVRINPDSNFDLADAPDVNTFWNPSVDPPLGQDDVTLVLDSNQQVTGNLVSGIEQNISYFGGSQISTYQVNFNQNLLEEVQGARVFVGNTLLGMLITINLVFPAHRI